MSPTRAPAALLPTCVGRTPSARQIVTGPICLAHAKCRSSSQVPTHLRHPETVPVPVPVLSGPRVTLRSVEARDRDSRLRLGWHEAIERNYGHERPTGPMSEREADDWLVEQRQLSNDSSRFDWVIDVDGDLAGVAFLHSMSEIDRKARFALGMFSPEFIGLGLGGEATRLVLGHAFDVLGLHRIDLRVLAFNTAAIRSYERCGFIIEGRERESCWLENGWHDDVVMGVLAREFAARQPG